MKSLSEKEITEIINSIGEHYDKIHKELVDFAPNAPTEGAIRERAGKFIENILQKIFDEINSKVPEAKIVSKVGRTDYLSKTVHYKGRTYDFNQIQVDRHIWRKGKRIAFIENKTYLDSCYYGRALSDFKKIAQSLNQHGKDPAEVKYIVFAGQNAIRDKTQIIYEIDFLEDTKYLTERKEGIEPFVFFIFKEKRKASKPLYKYKHELDTAVLRDFIELILQII